MALMKCEEIKESEEAKKTYREIDEHDASK